MEYPASSCLRALFFFAARRHEGHARRVRSPLFRQVWVQVLVVVMGFFLVGALRAQDAGFGPPIAVDRSVAPSTSVKPRNWIDQTSAEALAKSAGCLECHQGIDQHSMHLSPNVVLGCTDCHGGNPTPGLTQRKAHVAPRNPIFWESSANPSDSSVLLNHESPEFIQFVNPGDLRVAEKACGLCHEESVRACLATA